MHKSPFVDMAEPHAPIPRLVSGRKVASADIVDGTPAYELILSMAVQVQKGTG